jgi:molybdopterin-guanine dinucleotide biosynthesis protein B
MEADGCRLAIVKHTHHSGLRTDQTGSDSHRFWVAGAHHVTLATPDRIVHTHRCRDDLPLSHVLAGIDDVDLVLAEGYKLSSIPKMEIVRAAWEPRPLERVINRIAFITDVPELQTGERWFHLDDFEGVAGFLMDCFLGWE